MRLTLSIVAFAFLAALLAAALAIVDPAMAQEAVGIATEWQTGFQQAASPVMQRINEFHNFLLYVIAAISFVVLALLVICIVRFNARANPTPSKTTHNTSLEVTWTVVPIVILIAIAIPSFPLLFLQTDIPKADMTIKVTGYQWYWEYEYPDHDELTFDSILLDEDELLPGQHRLLSVDNPVVVPINANVRMLVTAADVIHGWAVPAFGVKMDAVPGRLNETWFRAEKTGIFYGQCSELCGLHHAFMPIEIHVVENNEFNAWLARAKNEFAGLPAPVLADAQGKTTP